MGTRVGEQEREKKRDVKGTKEQNKKSAAPAHLGSTQLRKKYSEIAKVYRCSLSAIKRSR